MGMHTYYMHFLLTLQYGLTWYGHVVQPWLAAHWKGGKFSSCSGEWGWMPQDPSLAMEDCCRTTLFFTLCGGKEAKFWHQKRKKAASTDSKAADWIYSEARNEGSQLKSSASFLSDLFATVETQRRWLLWERGFPLPLAFQEIFSWIS